MRPGSLLRPVFPQQIQPLVLVVHQLNYAFARTNVLTIQGKVNTVLKSGTDGAGIWLACHTPHHRLVIQ